MNDGFSKIIVLADHPKAQAAWDADYVQQLLKGHKTTLQILDDRLEVLDVHNRLKDARALRAHASKTQRRLDKISDWLDDKLEEENTNQEKLKNLQEKCKKLIDRSERLKKTISDDIS